MYKVYDKKINDIKQRLNITSDKHPQIVVITLNDNNNGFKWQISETYYKSKQAVKTNKIYVNDYKEYFDTIKNTSAITLIDDIGLCN